MSDAVGAPALFDLSPLAKGVWAMAPPAAPRAARTAVDARPAWGPTHAPPSNRSPPQGGCHGSRVTASPAGARSAPVTEGA